MDDTPQRLNKFLAHTLGISRREADDYLAAGRISVDGIPAILGGRFISGQTVALDGRPLEMGAHHYTYLLLNKPAGYVCSRRSQDGTPTIYELLPEKYHALKSVGRLDRDSSGLLLLTDDGDKAFEMTHPKFHKTKTYEVELDTSLQPLHRQMISDRGVLLDDGPSKLELERLHEEDNRSWRVVMHEGRNRQIRRTFAALGYTVTRLHRTHFGPYELNGLKEGDHLSV